ncbi:hypothetical protein SteCoe_32158 [Stentor coeruleus]|uniref:Histidine--tRNA ligase, cytoplasmic n=1 Tax=Stentor coeruleus TaxID=5963 RepID=A0A1R2AZV0_9CILI|nr:hypothetical protein SteCoe_32158 [Stentor coeruleus]
MVKFGIIINGTDLSSSDLPKLLEDSFKVDSEILKTLQPNTESLIDFSLHSNALYICIALNNYLKFCPKASADVVSQLNGSIHPSIQLPEEDVKYFDQDTYRISSELIPSLHNLSMLAPIYDSLLGLTMEAENIDSSFVNEDIYPLLSQGLKTTLSNIQSLLHDSKMAKKNSASETLIEFIQISAALKDTIEDTERILDKEINIVNLNVNKTIIKRTNQILVKAFNDLVCITAGLAGDLHTIHIEPKKLKFVDILPSLQAFQVFTRELLEKNFNELKRVIGQLTEFEAKINEGAAKVRQIQLGKGSRVIYQLLKDTNPTVSELSIKLVSLFATKNDERRVPKIAKGMRDYASEEMSIREHVFNVIRAVFKKHMADELDTPVMELRETLTGKYGEEGSKLIYNVADQGGELLSLRYDLTVPFARYVAINRITNWKRFQIGKVYRRDQPQMKRGRYREFYQCDFDIVGAGATMAQDAEVIMIVVEILKQLDFNFIVKINHRKLLDSFLDIAGCPSEKYRSASSSIDKLDKEEWAKIRTELIEDKGLSEECTDKIGEFVKLNGDPKQILGILKGMEILQKHAVASKILEELEKLVNYAESFGILERLNLDMSLARGLDYYTGLVYEAVVIDGQVGSIAGGGRYDELIMKLNNSNQPIPAVGVSLGVERLFTVIEERYKAAKLGETSDQSIQSLLMSKSNSVLVAQAGSSDRFDLIQERFKICSLLWARGINAETSYKEKSDPKGQAGYASQQGIRWIVWVGDSELEEGKAKIKDLSKHSEENVLIEAIPDFILSH